MRHRDDFLVLLCAALAVGACRGEIALGGAEGDGGIESGSTGSSSGSGGLSGGSSVVGGELVGQLHPHPGATRRWGRQAPVVLAKLAAPSGIAVDADERLRRVLRDRPVFEVPLDGGPVVTLDDIGQNTVAINTTSVYTVAGGGGNVPQGIVVGCAKTGCNGQYTTLATGQDTRVGRRRGRRQRVLDQLRTAARETPAESSRCPSAAARPSR